MNPRPEPSRLAVAIVAALVSFVPAGGQNAPSVKVMISGGFRAAYEDLVPEFERKTGLSIVTAYGGSMGNAPNAIPNRLQRGEWADVVILASSGFDELVKKHKVIPGTRVDLARSIIAMAVRAGAQKPDISTLQGLKRTLLAAKSIAYSDSTSGVYLSTELFQRLGIAEEIRGKCIKDRRRNGWDSHRTRRRRDWLSAVERATSDCGYRHCRTNSPRSSEGDTVFRWSCRQFEAARDCRAVSPILVFTRSCCDHQEKRNARFRRAPVRSRSS
jgi:ABC-type molybdate transport system substrate-binding protein